MKHCRTFIQTDLNEQTLSIYFPLIDKYELDDLHDKLVQLTIEDVWPTKMNLLSQNFCPFFLFDCAYRTSHVEQKIKKRVAHFIVFFSIFFFRAYMQRWSNDRVTFFISLFAFNLCFFFNWCFVVNDPINQSNNKLFSVLANHAEFQERCVFFGSSPPGIIVYQKVFG